MNGLSRRGFIASLSAICAGLWAIIRGKSDESLSELLESEEEIEMVTGTNLRIVGFTAAPCISGMFSIPYHPKLELPWHLKIASEER